MTPSISTAVAKPRKNTAYHHLNDDNVQIAFIRWFERHSAIYTKTARGYSGKNVVVLPAQEIKGVPAPAWTEPPKDDKGQYVCRIHVPSAVSRVVSVDPVTGRMVADGNKFHNIVSGLVYHEMGHVIFTAPIKVTLPKTVAYHGLHIISLLEFIETLPQATKEEAYFDVLLLYAYNSSAAFGQPTGLLDFIVKISERLADIIEPWVKSRIDGLAVEAEYVKEKRLVKAVDDLSMRGGTESLQTFAKQAIVDCQAILLQRWSPNSAMITKIHNTIVHADMNQRLVAWASMSNRTTANEANKFLTQTLQYNPPEYEFMNLCVSTFYEWGKMTKSWKKHWNILEDQRLETQLASMYLGMSSYFTDAIVSLMVPGQRYWLTNGRYYLSDKARAADLADEKHSTVAAIKQGIYSYGPIVHGWYRFMPIISKAYVQLLWDESKDQMMGLVALSMLFNNIFGRDYPVVSPLDNHDSGIKDVTAGAKKAGESRSEKRAAESVREKIKKLEQEESDDPNYELKKMIQATMVGLSRGLRIVGGAAAAVEQGTLP
jgi:hypothetical protein